MLSQKGDFIAESQFSKFGQQTFLVLMSIPQQKLITLIFRVVPIGGALSQTKEAITGFPTGVAHAKRPTAIIQERGFKNRNFLCSKNIYVLRIKIFSKCSRFPYFTGAFQIEILNQRFFLFGLSAA